MAEGYLGEIRVFASSKIPQNWMACNGQELPIAEYEALYSLIGQQYGGTGNSTFGLPNLQGQVITGSGQGPGLSSYTMGQTFGSSTVTLTQEQTTHSHGLAVSTGGATSQGPQGNVFAAAPASYATYVPNVQGTVLRPLDPSMLNSQGSGLSHSNIMPSLVINYIICVNGIYPNFD
jgi:microcystin-dependent protein